MHVKGRCAAQLSPFISEHLAAEGEEANFSGVLTTKNGGFVLILLWELLFVTSFCCLLSG